MQITLTSKDIDEAIKDSLVENGFTAPVKEIVFNKITKRNPRSVTVVFGTADAEVDDTPVDAAEPATEQLSFPE